MLLHRRNAVLGESLVKMLEDFMRSGGRLINTHDSVGWRGQPLLITDICARGVMHARDYQWIADRKHSC